jgi:CDP-diacylglycerol--serine O-phosphatidyltransferase
MRLRRFVRRRPQLRTILVWPTLVTMGNLLAGAIAIAHLVDAASTLDPVRREVLWERAAWLVFAGMLCDALDGRVARLTNTSSPFGAELDSLADVVTFGLVPAILARTLLIDTFPLLPTKLITTLCVVYVMGAALRLARYNVESARTTDTGERHVTLIFRGLPSPAAAGVIASLVLLRHEYGLHWMDWVALFATPLLGFLMISRMPYSHVLNRWLDGGRPLLSIVLLGIAVLLVVMYFHATVAAAFFLYALLGPVLWASWRLTGRPRWVVTEEEDEADEDEVDVVDGGPSAKDVPLRSARR